MVSLIGYIQISISSLYNLKKIFEGSNQMSSMMHQVKHSFLCESDLQKLEFLQRAFPDADHIFTDMADVAKGCAKDFKVDGRWQAVPEARSRC